MSSRFIPEFVRRARSAWNAPHRPRPSAIEPVGPGEESVWDFPRPPRLERVTKVLRVEFAGQTIAEASRGYRVCETASPPTYYFAPQDVQRDCLIPMGHRSMCEWKGPARYWSIEVGNRRAEGAVWAYPDPFDEFAPIAGWFAFYPAKVDACWVGSDRVTPQPGGFYGGWVTPGLKGPFKGEPGTEGW